MQVNTEKSNWWIGLFMTWYINMVDLAISFYCIMATYPLFTLLHFLWWWQAITEGRNREGSWISSFFYFFRPFSFTNFYFDPYSSFFILLHLNIHCCLIIFFLLFLFLFNCFDLYSVLFCSLLFILSTPSRSLVAYCRSWQKL